MKIREYTAAALRAGCALLLAGLLLAGCAAPPQSAAESVPAAGEVGDAGREADGISAAMPAETPGNIRDEDLDAGWDAATATTVVFSGAAAAVEGAGAAFADGTLTITAVGTYVLAGSLEGGQVVVNAPDTALVRLVLNGVSIHSAVTAPISCEGADKLVVVLAEGTTNTLTDEAGCAYPDAATDEPSAALFSRADLTINGTGSLEVRAAHNNGIGTKDDLIIVSGAITVEAANHAVRGRDSVTVLDGALTLTAGNDGIQANNDSGEGKGWIALYGGSFFIAAGHDGIQAETTLAVYGGSLAVTAGGGAAGAPARAEGFFGGAVNTAAVSDDTGAASDSFKGLKSGGDMLVAGGSLELDCADDALHSNAALAVSGGSLAIATGDDGLHADGALSIGGDGTSIVITQSYEGLEGATIAITGGSVDAVAGDDGMNAAGGGDGGQGGFFGRDSFAASGDYWIRIEGGKITLDAGGDGIDSNGDVTMTGGEVYISGPTNSGNGALDYQGDFAMQGGVLVAAGASGMAMNVGRASAQAGLLVYYSTAQPAGTEVELRDAQGDTLAAFTPQKEYQCVLVSAPGMAAGQTASLYTGGRQTLELELTAAAMAVSDTGQAVAGGMGGMGGGMGGQGGRQPGGQGGRAAPGGES